MEFRNTRLQGASGDAAALAYFASQGYPVSVPFSDGQRYDLIVEIDGKLFRVECKTATTKTPSGCYKVDFRTSGGNRSGTGKIRTISSAEVDLVFVLDGAGQRWLFTAEEVAGGRSVNLSSQRHSNLLA